MPYRKVIMYWSARASKCRDHRKAQLYGARAKWYNGHFKAEITAELEIEASKLRGF